MKNIISCSRRTDIPAFYYDWLQERLKEEYVNVKNPFNNKEYYVSLKPDETHSIVLWSKSFHNVINNPGYLSNYNLYFQFTITGYNNILEPNVIDYKDAVEQVYDLSNKYGPDKINFRFDPIILSTVGEINPTYDKIGKARLIMYERLIKDISSFGVKRCTISFVTYYKRAVNRLINNKIEYIDLSDDLKIKFTKRLVDISDKYDIQLYSCCNKVIENVNGINNGSCIDGKLLEKLFNEKCTKARDTGQRNNCGCSKSKDIGNYDMLCKHGCLYCYARPS